MTDATLDGTIPFSDRETIREANHRISNHLTLLAGLVRAKSQAIGSGPKLLPRETAHTALEDTAGKIVSIGHLHRHLSDLPKSKSVNLCNYLTEAYTTLVSSLDLGARVCLVQRLTANCNVTPEQAQKVGFMVNEIIMNAVKYAHPTGVMVQISMDCRREDNGRLTIEIGDDGVGLPEVAHANSMGGVGLKMIRSLSDSLNADLRIESDSLGLTFKITLPSAIAAVGVSPRQSLER